MVTDVIQSLITAASSSIPLCGETNCRCVCETYFEPNKNPVLNRAVCDGTMLGTLLKAASSAALYPLPQPPYTGMSFLVVLLKAKNLKVVSLCEGDKSKFPPSRPAHGQMYYIERRVDSILSGSFGLDLKTVAPM